VAKLSAQLFAPSGSPLGAFSFSELFIEIASVIRNACAHGQIHFRNPSAPPVSWRYGPADNGRKVRGSDVKLGEVLALMFKANDALDAIGALGPLSR
jgi:hypothetical protein